MVFLIPPGSGPLAQKEIPWKLQFYAVSEFHKKKSSVYLQGVDVARIRALWHHGGMAESHGQPSVKLYPSSLPRAIADFTRHWRLIPPKCSLTIMDCHGCHWPTKSGCWLKPYDLQWYYHFPKKWIRRKGSWIIPDIWWLNPQKKGQVNHGKPMHSLMGDMFYWSLLQFYWGALTHLPACATSSWSQASTVTWQFFFFFGKVDSYISLET